MNVLILDTSAVMAVYLNEPTATWVLQQSQTYTRLLMSTVNLAECLIALELRRPADADALARRLLASGTDFIEPDVSQAILVAEARDRYPLNFGDCFAYALAKSRSATLLTLDRDFRATDVMVILPPGT